MHRNLLFIKSYDGNFEELSLDMSVTLDESQGHRVRDLMPNGRNVSVGRHNRVQYIYLMADFRLNTSIHVQTASFLHGLSELIPRTWLNLFNPDELQMLIAGDEKPVDLNDMREHTVLHGYDPNSPTMVSFWNVLRSLPADDVRNLLRFITSCPRPPLLGFAHLKPRLGIQMVADKTRLPSASTCMNLLKLPAYADEATLRDRLNIAIKSNTGFGLS